MLLQPLASSPSCAFGPDYVLPVPGKDEATGRWDRVGTGHSLLQGQQLLGEFTLCALLDSASLSIAAREMTSTSPEGTGWGEVG